MMKSPLQTHILLASKSPRRSALLKDAGFHFTLIDQNAEEIIPENLPVSKVAAYLAELKGKSIQPIRIGPEQILLSADSVVILNDKIYGKPGDANEALQMLMELQGNTHEVITAMYLCDEKGFENCIQESTWVTFYPCTESELTMYIECNQPFDKAGSYAIQEWIGLCKIKEIRGSVSNVIGLPVHLLYHTLLNWPD